MCNFDIHVVDLDGRPLRSFVVDMEGFTRIKGHHGRVSVKWHEGLYDITIISPGYKTTWKSVQIASGKSCTFIMEEEN